MLVCHNCSFNTVKEIKAILMFHLQLRVVFMNLVGFVWSVYIATKRRRATERRGGGAGGAKGDSRPGM